MGWIHILGSINFQEPIAEDRFIQIYDNHARYLKGGEGGCNISFNRTIHKKWSSSEEDYYTVEPYTNVIGVNIEGSLRYKNVDDTLDIVDTIEDLLQDCMEIDGGSLLGVRVASFTVYHTSSTELHTVSVVSNEIVTMSTPNIYKYLEETMKEEDK